MRFLLSTAYLPNIDYFAILSQAREAVWLDSSEFYVKQSFRNRSHVLSPKGLLALSIPVCAESKHGVPIKDVRISDAFSWQRQHFKTLETCYRNAAYFDFFEPDIRRMYERKFHWLFDYNMEWIDLLFFMSQLSATADFKQMEEYLEKPPDGTVDLRARLHPKQPSLSTDSMSYTQVFSATLGFVPGLSFLDLLLNEGNMAKARLAAHFDEIVKNRVHP